MTYSDFRTEVIYLAFFDKGTTMECLSSKEAEKIEDLICCMWEAGDIDSRYETALDAAESIALLVK